MDEKERLGKKISLILSKEGYTNILINPFLKPLGWSFNLYAENNKEALAIEFRKNDNLPDILLERVKNIKKFKKCLRIFLLFEKVPRTIILGNLKKFGMGVMLFQKNKLYYLSDSKDFSRKATPKKEVKKKVKKIKSMPQIFVYPCSKQYEIDEKTICKERKIVCIIVRRYKRKQIPIDYKLVENDKKDDKQFKKQIIRNLAESQIFIAAITNRYSEYVDFEIKHVFDIIKDKMLILIMKEEMANEEIEEQELDTNIQNLKRKKQLELIEFAKSKTKIISYSGLKDFENKVDTDLMKMIDRLHKKNKIKSPFSY